MYQIVLVIPFFFHQSPVDLDGLPAAFPPNSELLTFSSLRFKRKIRNQSDVVAQNVRVRIPGLETFKGGSEEDSTSTETEEARSSFNDESSSTSLDKLHSTRLQLSHEDVCPVYIRRLSKHCFTCQLITSLHLA